MKVKFTAENFNKIVKLCGNVCAKKSDRRPVLEHICLDISYDQCIAVGVNGYELVKCNVECESEETGRVLILPLKPPRQATHVEIETDDQNHSNVLWNNVTDGHPECLRS